MPVRQGFVSFGAAVMVLACAPVAFAGPECAPVRVGIQLPAELDESSGAAVSIRDPDVIWTHNDDGSVLYALDRSGVIRATHDLLPRLRDWEDLAVSQCALHGSCLYAADTGDNAERRADGHIRLIQMPEPPTSGDPTEIQGEVFPIRLPDGARDIEALVVLDPSRIFLVTKGRNHAITVYRYPPPLRPDTVTLVEVQRLTDGAAPLGDQVTGASTSPNGTVVAIRTYQALQFFRIEADTLARIDDGLVTLRTLREPQGEAVALGSDGLVVMTSEGGVFGGEPVMNLLRCSVTA